MRFADHLEQFGWYSNFRTKANSLNFLKRANQTDVSLQPPARILLLSNQAAH